MFKTGYRKAHSNNITENKKGRENTTLPFLMPKNMLERTK